MVRAVLSVILRDEDGGVLPGGRVGHGVHQLAERVVVVRDISLWRGGANTGGLGVVIRQAHELDRGNRSGCHLGLEVVGPFFNTWGTAARLQRRERSRRIRAVQVVTVVVVVGLR